MIVIDASIAMKWFVDEKGREAAHGILHLIRDDPSGFAVPDLFYLEMTSVLARLLRSSAELDQVIADLYDLGMIQLRAGSKLLKAAGVLAMSYKLSGYDALYAASAQSLGGQWLTADAKAHAKIAALGISRLL